MNKDSALLLEAYKNVRKTASEKKDQSESVINEAKKDVKEDKKADKKDPKKDEKKNKKKALKESITVKFQELKGLIAEAEKLIVQ